MPTKDKLGGEMFVEQRPPREGRQSSATPEKKKGKGGPRRQKRGRGKNPEQARTEKKTVASSCKRRGNAD